MAITDNYTLDLGEEGILTLTKKVYDITEPDKRDSHFTKTITIPSSGVNDLIFQGMFDVNYHLEQTGQFEPFFNPTKKAPCILHTDTMEQMTGYAQLTDIVLNRDLNRVEYKLRIFGELRDLFSDLGNSTLADLDFSEYNHTYNETNIVNSWTAPIGTGYVYPQIDYGDSHIHWVNGVNRGMDFWVTEHFRPWIYVKTIWDKIFQSTGFRYSSSFITSDIFKRLIFQGDINGLTLDDSEIANKSTEAEVNTLITYSNIISGRKTTYCYTNYPIVYDNELTDPPAQYNPTTGTITIPSTRYYDFYTTIKLRITNNTGSSQFGNYLVKIGLVDSNGRFYNGRTWIYNFGTSIGVGHGNLANGANADATVPINLTNIKLNAGDELRFCILESELYHNGIATNQAGFDTKINIDTKLAVRPIAETVFGDTVTLNNVLSSEMTQREFIMNIVKMFNLYIEPYWFRTGDANSGKFNEYLIEPRDSYYTSDVVDWTYNYDTEKDFTISPAALSTNKFYYFTYKKDNDILNEKYYAQTNRTYGDYLHSVDNDFAKDTKKIEISFTMTLLSDNSQPEHWSRIMPVIKSVDGTPKQDGIPRILFYNGLRDGDTWNFNGTTYSQYPLASNVDDFDNPTCDLNFSHPTIVYYKGENGFMNFTTGTLFNRYYYKQTTEITDINSKLVTCYMRLRPSDIHNLSFRPYYFINGAYYRLYEVVDHNYTDTTLCKFLKISEATPIGITSTTTRGGRRITGTGTRDKTPTRAGGIIQDPVLTGYGGQIASGGQVGGGITPSGFVQWAGSNVLQGGTSRSPIIKDNIIALGYQILNVASGDTRLNGSEGSPMYIIADSSAGDVNIYIDDQNSENIGHEYNIAKDTAANSVKIYDGTDTLFHTITAHPESHKFIITTSGIYLFR